MRPPSPAMRYGRADAVLGELRRRIPADPVDAPSEEAVPMQPVVCIGAETLRKLRIDGAVMVSGVLLIAADDLLSEATR